MQKNNYNYGLSMLKMFMCFEVVLCHFWQYDNSLILKLFALMRNVAVPVFIMISFFLMKNFFINLNSQKLKKRLTKLFNPQFYWAIIYFIIYQICVIIIPNISLKLSLRDLLWQIFLGHSPNLNPSMWFQFDLIILTIIFSIICHRFNKKKIICLILLLLGALILQYSGLNYAAFSNMIYELKFPLGRIIEVLPYAVVGFILSYYIKYFENKNVTKLFIGGGVILTLILSKVNMIEVQYNFQYAGIKYILISFTLVLCFYKLPFNKISNRMLNIINFISKYTLGIYCIHRLIGTILINILEKININSFVICILIYLLSFLASYIISHLFPKLSKNLV